MKQTNELPKFKVGDRVILLPIEDQPLQHGVVEVVEGRRYPDMYLVRVPKEDKYDDGIREVHASSMAARPAGLNQRKFILTIEDDDVVEMRFEEICAKVGWALAEIFTAVSLKEMRND